MKRGACEGDNMVPAAKRVHTSDVADALDELKEQQKALDKFDDECAIKQMEIQRKYDEMKRPLFDARKSIIAKIPNFWGTAVCNCFHIRSSLAKVDPEILSHLVDIELDDNMDQHGSYKIAFVFDEGVKTFFEPIRLEKTITFSDKNDEGTEICTQIRWKENKRPVMMIPEAEDEDDDENRNKRAAGDFIPTSVLEWFSTDSQSTRHESFGEIIRRSVFHQPITCFEPQSDEEEDDDDDDEIDDENDDEDDDEDSETVN